jgi:predicted patatin/cPLA2 family phospholipase
VYIPVLGMIKVVKAKKHPVIELMRRRKSDGSKPGDRADDAKLALVIEGGGMRGIISAGMASAIEQLGFLDSIDEVYGTSAGALNGAFLLAGQASWSCTLYYDYLNKERFLDFNRLLKGQPPIDMEWLAKDAYARERRLNYDAILKNPIKFHCMATKIDKGNTVDLTNLANRDDIESALLATSRIPFLAGDPHEYKGEKYIDGGLTDPIPIDAAITNGATHVLILQTRPDGVSLKESIADPLVERFLQSTYPALEDLYEERVEKYENIQRFIDVESKNKHHKPAIFNLKLPASEKVIGTFEKNTEKLVAGASSGLKLMEEALLGDKVEVEQVLQAFPGKWYG